MGLVNYRRDGAVTTLALNRPERQNALVPELLMELLAGLRATTSDAGCAVVVLTTGGRSASFSAGEDPAGFIEHQHEIVAYARRLIGLLNEVILTLIDLPVPIIAAGSGTVNGGAVGLMLAADLILMTPATLLQPGYSTSGIAPAGGWATLLPAAIGRHRAAALLYLNEPISATTAVEWGLAAQIVPPDQLEARASELAGEIAARKRGAVRHAKKLLWADRSAIADRLQKELEHYVDQITTMEAREGLAALEENFNQRE